MGKIRIKLTSDYKDSGYNKIEGIFDDGGIIAIYNHTEYHSPSSRNVVYYSTLYSKGTGRISS
jgi:hypothetical protein